MQDNVNPYASPLTTADSPSDDSEYSLPLARRGTRLLAAIIDGVLMSVLFGLPYIWVLTQLYPAIWSPESVIEPGMSPQEAQAAIAAATQPSIAVQLFAFLFAFILFLILQGYLLASAGQTIGKRFLGIRIVRRDGSQPTFGRLIGLRYLPMWFVSYIPFVGTLITGLIDPLLIFRSSRRCLHDDIADTLVIEV